MADEKGIVPEILLELLIGIGSNPKGPDVEYLGIKESLRMRFHIPYKSRNKILRLGAARTYKNVVASMDMREYL
jgi:hypothetical protein